MYEEGSSTNTARTAPKRAARRTQAASSSSTPPSAVTPSSIACELAHPEFVTLLQYECLRDMAVHRPADHPTLDEVADIVEAKRESSVLCCTGGDGGVTTLCVAGTINGLPGRDEPHYHDYVSWFKPEKWNGLAEQRASGNKGSLKSISSCGNYNEVLAPTSDTPTSDHSQWPCIMNEVSKVSAIALRMTRSDPFPCEDKNESPQYRSMKLEAVKSEMAMSLHAAAHCFGAPIHAVVSWPWKEPKKPKQGNLKEWVLKAKKQEYGLIMIMPRMRSDGAVFQNIMYDNLVGGDSGPLLTAPVMYRRCAEVVSRSMIVRCYEMACAGLINFDIKPSNILVDVHGPKPNFTDPLVYVADFDAVYCVPTPCNVAGTKARFFTMLLLLAAHVRGYSTKFFVDSFVKVAGPLLMELWGEIHATYHAADSSHFGAGSAWLFEAEIAANEERGEFNIHEIRQTASAPLRLSKQLVMMSYEYFPSCSNGKTPKRITSWPWATMTSANGFFETRGPRLVPQLLAFSILYMKPIPDAWKDVLKH